MTFVTAASLPILVLANVIILTVVLAKVFSEKR